MEGQTSEHLGCFSTRLWHTTPSLHTTPRHALALLIMPGTFHLPLDLQAVTCDDFLAAMADANGEDLSTLAKCALSLALGCAWSVSRCVWWARRQQRAPPRPGQVRASLLRDVPGLCCCGLGAPWRNWRGSLRPGAVRAYHAGCLALAPRRWYSQAGTPRVTALTAYNPSDKTFTLKLSQV